MSNANLEPGSLATLLLAQLVVAAMLVAVRFQWWLALRVTNPCAAYAEVWLYLAAGARHVRARVGGLAVAGRAAAGRARVDG